MVLQCGTGVAALPEYEKIVKYEIPAREGANLIKT